MIDKPRMSTEMMLSTALEMAKEQGVSLQELVSRTRQRFGRISAPKEKVPNEIVQDAAEAKRQRRRTRNIKNAWSAANP